MNQKIESAYNLKLKTLNKWQENNDIKLEKIKDTYRAKTDRLYNIKLRKIEKRKETQYKNIVRKEKWKPLILVKKKETLRVKKTDDIFSKYMRKKYGLICCTCWGNECIGMWHWITRMCRALRRDERNGGPQWFRCCNNKITGNGRPLEMKAYLQKRSINTEKLEKIYMDWKYKGKEKPSEQEIIVIYEYFKKKLAELEW